jgi:hypothetical protein
MLMRLRVKNWDNVEDHQAFSQFWAEYSSTLHFNTLH